jgi:hypothetical protein
MRETANEAIQKELASNEQRINSCVFVPGSF